MSKTIVKFKKDHVSGIKKNDVKRVDKALAEKWIEEKFAAEASEEDLEKFRSKMAKTSAPDKLTEAKEAVNESKSECEDCGGSVNKQGECEGCNEEEEGSYHKLTQEDIDALEDAAEGFNPGDEVEMDEDGNLCTGEDGKLILKEGND